MSLYDYREAGFKVFGLYGVDNKGVCGCGNQSCKALYKHPIMSNWQIVPYWSDEQMETFELTGQFKTGFGVLCSGYLVVDVDARNGGVESFAKLCEVVPLDARFVVNTGSGNGSQHHYFKLTEPLSLVQNLPDYPGIDFKTSGYVVGAGSMHASGMLYEVERGFPQDVGPPPDALLELLKKPDAYRVKSDAGDVDVTEADIQELLGYIKNSAAVDYEQWIKIGMAIHHCLNGGGFDLWLDWSATGPKHDPGMMDKKWHSFGKSANPAGYGTLIYHAREGGYCEPVTFEYTTPESDGAPVVDLKRPPGFVGELTQWINDQCMYPRENLAVAAALCAVSGLAGMRFHDEADQMSANLIAFCVAGSGTGKEAVIQAYLQIMEAADISAAVHGGFKSEQELMRNLVRHQAALYCVDELGTVLQKLENATKRGGASYLEGLVGLIMSIYSKANAYLPITGDLKEEVRDGLICELSKAERQIDEKGETPPLKAKADQARAALASIDKGLVRPYLTILGYTTPVTFNDLIGYQQATNGFVARAMIFEDSETNPKDKRGFTERPMGEDLASAIRNLHAPGRADMDSAPRIEFVGDKTGIPTEPEAADLLRQIKDHFWEEGEKQKEHTGLEPIPRRGYELAAKVSLLLAMPGGVRTVEHVQWAFELAKADVERKIKLVYGNIHKDEANGIAARVLSVVNKEHGETLGVLKNKAGLRNISEKQLKEVIDKMVAQGMIRLVEVIHKGNKKKYIKVFAK
ncbi:MAG: PriCT-2 domain-containing protein [Gammaproteobacteria bacterium]